jgi:hypothetical protein
MGRGILTTRLLARPLGGRRKSEEESDIIRNKRQETDLRRHLRVLLSILFFLNAIPALPVTTTDLNSVTPLQLAQMLAGPGVTVSNVVFTGANVAGGSFTGGLADGLGIASGVILSSGNIANAAGPNTNDGITTVNMTAGDADLNTIVGVGHTTFDAAVLEFDFVPTSSPVSFRYVFSSDEYNEFVGEFNDVFAFLIDGVNVALIPSTSTPVAINTVNLGSNPAFYRNNDPSDLGTPTPFGTQFDGFTTVLTATANLTPNVSHHIKLVIADTDDELLDSAVFLEAASFQAGQTPTPTPTATVTPTGQVPSATPTVTIPAPTATLTPTIIGGGPGIPTNIPTLSPGILVSLGVLLAAVGLLLLRRL